MGRMDFELRDLAIQVHGGAGICDDTPLAWLYAHVHSVRVADGPDEVHKMGIARRELKPYARPDDGHSQ